MTKTRLAITDFFFLAGFINSNWASRIPEMEKWLSISHAQLGTYLLVIAIGAMIAMPTSGYLSSLFGSKQLVRWGGIGTCLALPVLLITTNPLFVWLSFLFLGLMQDPKKKKCSKKLRCTKRIYKSCVETFKDGKKVKKTCGEYKKCRKCKRKLRNGKCKIDRRRCKRFPKFITISKLTYYH